MSGNGNLTTPPRRGESPRREMMQAFVAGFCQAWPGEGDDDSALEAAMDAWDQWWARYSAMHFGGVA
jgi:hypothetical protein